MDIEEKRYHQYVIKNLWVVYDIQYILECATIDVKLIILRHLSSGPCFSLNIAEYFYVPLAISTVVKSRIDQFEKR